MTKDHLEDGNLLLSPDLHVDSEGPDVQREDRFPEPAGEVQLIETTPGPRQETGREGAV